MRLEERRLLKLGLIVAAVGAMVPVIYLTGIVFLGFSVAPHPVAEKTPAPALIKDAIWTRAGGGRAKKLRSINPVSMAQFVTCMALATGDEDFRGDNHGKCDHLMPAIYGLEYFSAVHLREHGVQRYSFRGGAGSMATMLRLTHSWTREDLLNTLAARADFGYGWRGVDSAARGFFGRSSAELTLAQVAFIASRVGDTGTDPWCETDAAIGMRNRVLTGMRDNGLIAESDFQSASTAELGLVSPPEGRPACGK